MTEEFVDLHVHSNKSDGSYTPAELVAYAIEKGLSAMALTDHDTVDGLTEAITAAEGTGLEIIPGVELSTEYHGKDIHVLGLFVDTASEGFGQYLYKFQHAREIRNEKMAENLQKLGFDITIHKLYEAYPVSVLTRSHFARYLFEKGYTSYIKEAFERYIGDNGPCFVPREKVSPMQAVDLIHRAGGLAILAHPPLYHMGDAKLTALVAELKKAGLDGIEAIYTTYNSGEERQMRHLAKSYGLLLSGGSDFHGAVKPKTDLAVGFGNLFVPKSILDTLKKAILSPTPPPAAPFC